jgi:PPP family 3-phenylpropionic acid transporter
MRALRAVFLLNGAALGVFYPFISVILADRDVPPAWIGIVMAASSAAFTIAVPAWGHIADVILGRRRALAVSALGAAAFVLLAGAPVEVVVVALALVGFSVFESAWGPLGDALAVNAIKDHGRDYARIRLLSSVGFGVVSALAGILYNTTGYGPSFVLCALLSLLLAVAAIRAPDLARADLAAVARGHTRGGSFMVALRIQPRLGPVLLAILLIHVGVIAGFTYLPLRLIELGGGPSDVALNAAVSAFAEIPAMLLTGAVAARIGIRGLVAGSAFLYAACFLSWTVLDVPMLIVATRVVTGFAFAGLWVGSVLTMAVLLPPRLQGTGQGLYQVTAFGVAAVIANIAGGFIFGALGSAVLFGIAAVLAVTAGLLAFLVFPRRGERVAREEEEEEEAVPLPFPATPA